VRAPVPVEGELRDVVILAWDRVRTEEKTLFVYQGSLERPAVFHFARAMADLVAARALCSPSWLGLSVDSELHRQAHGNGFKPGPAPNSKYAQPDIVLHERGSQLRNLLAIEAKWRRAPTDWDRRKLRQFATKLSYINTLAVRLDDAPLDLSEWRGREAVT
jgi:hypothetical protein